MYASLLDGMVSKGIITSGTEIEAWYYTDKTISNTSAKMTSIFYVRIDSTAPAPPKGK